MGFMVEAILRSRVPLVGRTTNYLKLGGWWPPISAAQIEHAPEIEFRNAAKWAAREARPVLVQYSLASMIVRMCSFFAAYPTVNTRYR
jgi:hypothetical protein